MLDKLKFWKKHDTFDFDELTSSSANLPGSVPKDDLGLGPSVMDSPSSSFGQKPRAQAARPSPPSFGQERAEPGSGVNKTEIELLSSKLDTIKALLQSLDQRVARIEQIAGAEQQKQKETSHLW